MKKFLHSRDGASKGAALIIVLAFVVLVTVLAVTYFSRTTTDRQLAQSSYNDTSADLLARSALDITVSDLKQEIANNPTGNHSQYSASALPGRAIPTDNPNLIRTALEMTAASRASTVSSTAASANGRSISLARWNSHYLIPRASTTTEHRFHTCGQFHRAGLGAGNCSGTESRACAKCGDWKICFRGL